MNLETERARFNQWLGIKHCGAAHDLAWHAWQARAALEAKQVDVKMPEPFTSLVRKKSWSPNCYEASPLSSAKDYGRQWADERINVYTEQQVRALLAKHGINIAD